MQEAEVSLRIAIYYIKNQLTDMDVKVSLDGAHIKTGEQIHFDIFSFMEKQKCEKEYYGDVRWQGEYIVDGYKPKIVISSTPGIGDVNITLKNGKMMYIESKKGKDDKKGQEYPLMREAIGQIMTGCQLNENIIPAVAVPYSEKSFELAMRWSEYKQIKVIGIKFVLVKLDGSLVIV